MPRVAPVMGIGIGCRNVGSRGGSLGDRRLERGERVARYGRARRAGSEWPDTQHCEKRSRSGRGGMGLCLGRNCARSLRQRRAIPDTDLADLAC